MNIQRGERGQEERARKGRCDLLGGLGLSQTQQEMVADSHYPGVAALWGTADIGRNGGRALHLHAVLGCLLRSISADKKNRQRPAQFQARI